VVVLPLFMTLVAFYGLVHYAGWTSSLFTVSGSLPVDFTLLAGFIASVAAFALFIFTRRSLNSQKAGGNRSDPALSRCLITI
jgi:hypothetical protein